MDAEFEPPFDKRSLAWQLPVLALVVILAVTFAFKKDDSAFASAEQPKQTDVVLNDNPHNRVIQPSFIETFETEWNKSDWYISDYTVSGGYFRNSWSIDNVEFPEEGGYSLKLLHARSGSMPFVGGEVQRTGWVQYGRIEGIMRPAPGSGAASGLFTYTGNHFGDPHDEIDIEWIGNRPDLVQFNVYRDGKALGAWKHTLPFEPAAALHLYAFEWDPDEIRWYVDGELIHSVTSEEVEIPFSPQRLMTHLWTGTLYQWHGEPSFTDGTQAEVRCISYQRLDEMNSTPRCADEYDRILRGAPHPDLVEASLNESGDGSEAVGADPALAPEAAE